MDVHSSKTFLYIATFLFCSHVVSVSSDSIVTIKSNQTGLFLTSTDINGREGSVTIEQPTGDDTQKWRLVLAPKSTVRYNVINQHTGKYLDVVTDGSGARVLTTDESRGNHVLWKLYLLKTTTITNAYNNLAVDVDVPAWKEYKGSQLAVYPTKSHLSYFNITVVG